MSTCLICPNLIIASTELIKVEGITDVTWNKDAFKRLVLPKENKELIQAAVMAQGHLLSASPDIIAGKGQGLLILLHGGPGTGKTLTAESIAETQERPLYRVTCGDIGIEPTQVEQVSCVAVSTRIFPANRKPVPGNGFHHREGLGMR
jgi:transcriptional regulator with AAA-type ATPase domain